MLKPLSLCVLILVLATGLIHADVYRCKDANGTLLLTDDPSSFPPECQVNVVKDLPLLNVVPSTPSQPVRQKKAIRPPSSTDGVQSQKKVDRGYGSFKEEAETLVKEFHLTRKGIRYKNEVTKRITRRELTEIHKQIGSLLSEVDQSTLNGTQKKKVREIVAPITE